LFEFLDRALDGGFVVGHRDVPGLTPPGWYRPARTRGEWARWSAAGALLVTKRGRRGWVELGARVAEGAWREFVVGGNWRWWLGTRCALLAGAWRGWRLRGCA
jgi:hypothetical protein